MATPFLLMLFSPQEAMQINILLSLVISVALIWKVRHDVDVVLVKKVIIGSIIGAPFGSILFALVDLITFQLLIAIILIGLTILLMSNITIQQTNARDYSVGFVSGLLTTSIGMAGPPLLLYFAGTHKNKETIRATSLAYYIVIYVISLAFHVSIEGTNSAIWSNSLYALPVVFIGLVLGQLLFKRLNQTVFRKIIYFLLVAAGLLLIVQSIVSMYG